MLRYSRNQTLVLTALATLSVALMVAAALIHPARAVNALTEERNSIVNDSAAYLPDTASRPFQTRAYHRPRKEPFRFELNSVTFDRLITFPRIAKGRANAIIGYRERLGGYYSVDQLSEIRIMNDTLVDELRRWAFVSTDSIRRIPVADAPISRMKYHPYITYDQARQIDSARWVCQRRGHIFTPDSCRRYFGDDWPRVRPYLK